jgi:acylphosphatase
MPDTRAVRVRIGGRVQGVGFRAWTRGEAVKLGLSGWVRNLPGGDVEAVFSGPDAAVEAMLALCRHGPRYAHVDLVEEVGPAEPASGPFEVRRSYPP